MKKSLKIFLILVLALMLSLSLVACGSGNKNNSGDNQQEQPENSYHVNVGSYENGSVTIFAGGAQKENGDYIESGVNVTIEMRANDNFVVSHLTISELNVDKTYNSKTENYDFTMPSSDVNVSVIFGTPSTSTYSVTTSNPTGGKVTVNKSTAAQGETVTLSNTPDTGYKFVNYVVNGKTQTSNTFTMPNGAVTVTANFSKIQYNVSVTNPTGGKITVDKTTATYGEKVTLSNTPDSNYKFANYIVNGKAQTANTFSMPASNVTVSGAFTEITYNVTVKTGSNGSVTASASSIGVGKTVTLTVKPSGGYVLTSLKVDGTECVSSVKNNTYTFQMPSHNVEVTYAFTKVYNVSTSAVTNGKISVSATSVVYNSTVTVIATPDNNYVCEEITIAYGSTTKKLDVNSNKATFTMPNQDVVVSAKFVAKDSREYVSHMLLGDSYTDTAFYNDFYSDFSAVSAAKDIGIGGTQVPQWITGLTGTITQFGSTHELKVKDKYNVSNFIFHIGVNDIDGGTAKETVVENLKTLFTEYHNAYPNAKIYWISMSLNTMFASSHTNDYIYVNNQMKSYMSSVSYLEYIDTCSVMFPDNQPVADWFADGLHFNPDGYDTWGALILKAIGYPKEVGGSFGQAGNYYSSATFKANSDGSISNTTATRGEQNLWFNGVYADNAYAEMSVTVKEIKNSDKAPKFGMSIKTATNHVFFWIDATNLTGTGVGVTYRTPVTLDGGYQASNNWNWSVPLNGSISSGYKDNSYIKLGLLKSGSDLFFYVDDVLVNSISVLDGVDGSAAIGLTLFNLNVNIKNYSVTTNIASKLNSLDSAAKVRMETGFDGYTISGNTVTNTTSINESSAWVSGLNHSKFYFETEMTLNSVLNNDTAPKGGITVNLAGVGTLLFYIDSLNNADVSFGSNAWVGIVYRPNGGNWDWDHTSISYVRGLQYTNGSYAKLGLYKNGSKFIFTVNGSAILETNQYTGFSGNVNVGVMVFNLAFTAKNCSVVLSNSALDRMMTARKMTDDITVDGNITEWGTHNANSYQAYSTDGRGFKVYAFMGKNAIYVAYEIKSNTYVTNASTWFENTNVEMYITNGGGAEQLFASVNGQVRSVKSFAFKSTTSGSLKVTTVELAISYNATVTTTGTEQSIAMGFACRPGSEVGTGMCEGADGVWWCGPNHATGLKTSLNSTGII